MLPDGTALPIQSVCRDRADSDAAEGSTMKLRLLLLLSVTLAFATGCETRHHAKLYRLKNHHIVLQDDKGKWWEYTKNGLDLDINTDVTWNSKSEMVLPRGGSWRMATVEEEEEVTVEGEATNVEETTVDESDAGAVDGSGDVGGDDGGAGGDGGAGDGGGDGGGGDGD